MLARLFELLPGIAQYGTVRGYIAVGVWLEERDLRATFGESYESYRREVPAIIPFLGGRGTK